MRLSPTRRDRHASPPSGSATEPSVCHDLKGWARQWPGAAYTVSQPPRVARRLLPRTIDPEVEGSFAALCSYPVPERGLVRIPNARIRGQVGVVFLPDGQVPGELVAMTPAGRLTMLRAQRAFSDPLPAHVTRLAGNFYSGLTSGYNNYYHYSHDVAMQAMGVAHLLPTDTQLIVPQVMTAYQREALTLAGLDRYPWLPLPEGELWELENLFVASPTSKTQLDLPEHFAAYRQAALEKYAGNGPLNRLFITRRDDHYWRADNESELADYLTSNGFTVLSPSKVTVGEQIKLFSRAELVIGTGAGMTNIMFSPTGAHLVQLQEAHHVTHSFWTMAEALGLDYHYLMCDVVANPGAANVDIHVPMDKLRATLKPLL